MSQPRHHPSSELILDHARGALDAGRALVLDAHIRACPACAADVRAAEAVGGALLNELPPAEMAADALERVLARIERPAPKARALRQPPDWIKVSPDVLAAAARRRRWAAPGVWVATVTQDRRTGAPSYLLGVGANIAVPLHSHRGQELICVLKGAYEDRGAIHSIGDFAENDDEVEHKPRSTFDGECVCLIAADAALVPRSWMARLLQPVVGI